MAADSTWLTSVPEAMAQARRENKTVLLDFTGSDWCGWCKKLDSETFSKPEFQDYASKHVVLVMVDFPSKKVEQSDEVKAANKALSEKYDIHGYPSLVQLSPDGTILWKQRGYLAGGPEAMIAALSGGKSKSVATAPAAHPAVDLATVSYPVAPAHRLGEAPKLQGIFWSSSHPSVILQGKTCEEGDSVEGMRVLKIARDKVTVEWKGQTKELTMR